MVTKFPIIDESFFGRMLGACSSAEEMGLFLILHFSGMHISSLRSLKIISRGSRAYLSWVRPKTNKTLECLIPGQYLNEIQAFLAKRPHTRQHYRRIIKEIGERAGYEGVSPMTLRHNRCIRSIKAHDHNPFIVAQDMGCSVDVVFRNYSKLKEIEGDGNN